MLYRGDVLERWRSLFHKRYRDSVAEIRAACAGALGEWMQRYPSVFVSNDYLKYMGFNLYDKVRSGSGHGVWWCKAAIW